MKTSYQQSPCRKDHHNKDQLKNDLTKSSGFSFMIVPLGEVIFTHPSAAMLRETFLPSLNGMTNSLDMAVSAIRIVRELLLQEIDLPILKALQNQRKRNRPLLTVNDIPCIFFHIMVQDQCAYPVHFLIARHSIFNIIKQLVYISRRPLVGTLILRYFQSDIIQCLMVTDICNFIVKKKITYFRNPQY